MHKTPRQAFATLVPASLMLMVTAIGLLHAQAQIAGFEVASIRRNVSGSSRGSVSLSRRPCD